MAGPFREGYELFLSCQVTGGKKLLLTIIKKVLNKGTKDFF